MFLTPETTFAISVKTEIVEKDGVQIPTFSITEGGSIQMRTATGREFAKILTAMRDTDSLYALLPTFIVSGIDLKRIDDLHPGVVHMLIQEVFKRSRVSEVERGK
jgi:hypothetical protein